MSVLLLPLLGLLAVVEQDRGPLPADRAMVQKIGRIISESIASRIPDADGRASNLVQVDPEERTKNSSAVRDQQDESHSIPGATNIITARVINKMESDPVRLYCNVYEYGRSTVEYRAVFLKRLESTSFQMNLPDDEFADRQLICSFAWRDDKFMWWALYKNSPHRYDEPLSNWLVNEQGLHYKTKALGFSLVREWENW